MTEIQRLVAAIAKISEVYLVRVAAKGDTAGILKWSLRLADYSTRLAALVAPPLTVEDAEELGESVVIHQGVLGVIGQVSPAERAQKLTEDEEWAIFLDAEDIRLKELGRPYGRDGAERGALPLLTHIQMCEELDLPILGAMFKSFVKEGMAQ